MKVQITISENAAHRLLWILKKSRQFVMAPSILADIREVEEAVNNELKEV